jgi:hypothetical protein
MQVGRITLLFALFLSLQGCLTLQGYDYDERQEIRYTRKRQKAVDKLTRNYPDLLTDRLIRDTIVHIVEKTAHDTILILGIDTVVINKDRLKIEIIRLKGDSIYIRGECASDTIRIPYEVRVPVIIRPASTIPKRISWPFWLLIAVCVVLIYRSVK